MSDFNLYKWKENCRDGTYVNYVWDGSAFCWSTAKNDNTIFYWSDVTSRANHMLELP